MSSPKRPAAPIDRPVAKQCKCGVCGQLGHNRRKCPAAPAAPAAPVVDGQVGMRGGGEQHTPVHIEGGQWSRCAYCALMSRTRRTRIQCAGCGVPLCSIGNGRVGDDCFTLAHETEDRREMVCRKYDEMKKRLQDRN
jgi:hypothetical protein